MTKRNTTRRNTNAFHPFESHRPTTCAICGAEDIRLDYFDGDVPLELGECKRCRHRWTQSMLMPRQLRSGVNAAARLLEDVRNLPHAA